MKANWTDEPDSMNTVLKYDSNNDSNKTVSFDNAYSKLTQYIDLLTINSSSLSDTAFGSKQNSTVVSSAGTATGDTSDDGSYDKNVTSDTFVVNKNTDKYYSGVSNGRQGFFSFQGWSTWKFATWRDAIDSNKKDYNDPDSSEKQDSCGHDSASINSYFSSGSMLIRHYNDVSRSKRVGDLFYRMSSVLYPYTSYNGDWTDSNKNDVNNDNFSNYYSTSKSSTYWSAYKWRWQRGTSGNYSVSIKNVLDAGITLYAIWDSYPTSSIENVYCYRNDIEKLTPGYLFSKVIVTDYEDFWNQTDSDLKYSIGAIKDGNVDWNTVASASHDMNNVDASTCPAGDYTYTYNIKDSSAYMGGQFTATLVNYDYNKFINARAIDDIASVSITYKFVDSAGNTTYKTAWVYIIDNDDTERDNDPNPDPDPDNPDNPDSPSDPDDPDDTDPNNPDNTRYSLTRFISKEFYDEAEFDSDGNYVAGSADESAGSLLVRSKWYLLDSYKSELLDTFDRLETLGGARYNLNLKFDLSDMYSLRPQYQDADGNKHLYRPSYDYENDEWDWDSVMDNVKSVTKGVYVLDYDTIVKTKAFVQEHNSNSGNFDGSEHISETNGNDYTGDTIQEYIDTIFGDTAVKSITD
jgi:hypothetical protein